MGILNLLSAQASKTLYFYIAPPLKAALVHFVTIQFFIDSLRGADCVVWWEMGQDQ